MARGHLQDTIAAIATAPGEAGIAIVRVSGSESLRIADAVFRCRAPLPSQRAANTFVHGVVCAEGDVLDDAILLIMRAPHSYTGEDTIEIQGHGGSIPARRILRRVLAAGARTAEPGEFTRRAFLNGRMDLAQAEAVQDLIRAQSERAAAAAVEQLEGALSRRVNALYDDLLSLAADLEASLDFPEDELPPEVLRDIGSRLDGVRARLAELIGTAGEGRILREGARVVIAGRPNAGKSTLMNQLLGANRAIVSQHPGTTRDTIEEMIVVDGYPVRLVDTAGLRETGCEVEKLGIERTVNELHRSDACLYVVDASNPPTSEDWDRMKSVSSDLKMLIKNKMDICDRWPGQVDGWEVIPCSAVNGVGVSDVRQALGRSLIKGIDGAAIPHATVSERHAALLGAGASTIGEAAAIMSSDMDVAAGLLRDALENMGRITGRVYESELLDRIFSRFCIGK